MPNVFQPEFLVVGIVGLLVGAALGEWLRHAVHSQRRLIAVGVWVGLAVIVLSGVGLGHTGPDWVSPDLSGFAVMRQMALIGAMIGVGLFLTQSRRSGQVFGLAVNAVIGLPLLTNVWIGSGLTQSMYGL